MHSFIEEEKVQALDAAVRTEAPGVVLPCRPHTSLFRGALTSRTPSPLWEVLPQALQALQQAATARSAAPHHGQEGGAEMVPRARLSGRILNSGTVRRKWQGDPPSPPFT